MIGTGSTVGERGAGRLGRGVGRATGAGAALAGVFTGVGAGDGLGSGVGAAAGWPPPASCSAGSGAGGGGKGSTSSTSTAFHSGGKTGVLTGADRISANTRRCAAMLITIVIARVPRRLRARTAASGLVIQTRPAASSTQP